MRLRQMDAGSADLFPKISDGVQSDEARALFDVKEQSTYNGQQHVRLFEVQVHLVRAESCPHFFPSRAGGKFREQRERAWPHNLREIRVTVYGNEEVSMDWIAPKECLKPIALRRDMVEYAIKHEVKVLADAGDVVPASERGIHGKKILHGKSIVGGRRIKRQQMHTRNDAGQMPAEKVVQGLQRRLASLGYLVSVRDKQSVTFRERELGARTSVSIRSRAWFFSNYVPVRLFTLLRLVPLLQAILQILCYAVTNLRPINKAQIVFNRGHRPDNLAHEL